MFFFFCTLTRVILFVQLIKKIEDGILNGSRSATLKDFSDHFIGDVRCNVRLFERYSIADYQMQILNKQKDYRNDRKSNRVCDICCYVINFT